MPPSELPPLVPPFAWVTDAQVEKAKAWAEANGFKLVRRLRTYRVTQPGKRERTVRQHESGFVGTTPLAKQILRAAVTLSCHWGDPHVWKGLAHYVLGLKIPPAVRRAQARRFLAVKALYAKEKKKGAAGVRR